MYKHEWREAVLSRDGHKCVRCDNGNNLHAHHIQRQHSHPHLALVVDNGETLCKECHVDEHEKDMPKALTEALRGNIKVGKRGPQKKKKKAEECLMTGAMWDLFTRLGWSQKYFSSRVNVSVNTVNNWCTGSPNSVAMKYLEDECRRQDV